MSVDKDVGRPLYRTPSGLFLRQHSVLALDETGSQKQATKPNGILIVEDDLLVAS